MSTHPKLFPNELEKYPGVDIESAKYLENTLKNLESGRGPTPSFKLYGNDNCLEQASKLIDHFAEKHAVPDFVVEYERSRLAKVGPQGGYPAWKEVESIFLLYKEVPTEVAYVDPQIIAEMKGDYRTLRCQMRSPKDALEHLKKTNKIETRAAGAPKFQLKKTDPEAQKVALDLISSGLWDREPGYTFEKWQKQKPRIFMPMPFCLMIKQAQYFVPFLNNIQQDLLNLGENSRFLPWADKIGFDNCFSLVERKMKKAISKHPAWRFFFYKTDFEKMDTCTGPSQYKSFFLPCLDAAFGCGSKDRDHAMLMTTTADIISPSGTMKGGHGTASGAEVTNGGEGCGNDYYQRRTLKLFRIKANTKGLAGKYEIVVRLFNGDDGEIIIIADPKYAKVIETLLLDAAEQASAETKFRIQREKQGFDTWGVYCQIINYWDYENMKLLHYYPMVLTMNSIMNPIKEYSKSAWDKDYRDIDIVEKLDVMYGHPWWTDTVNYVSKGTKYPLLGSSEKETARILSKYDRYRAEQTLGERYNRQDYDISKSKTVAYLLSQR